MRKIDLTGQSFGRLTVVGEYKGEKKYAGSKWICKCICGNTAIIARSSLVGGRTKSCGCLNDEVRRKPKEKERKRSEKYKKIENRYYGIKRRCYSEKDKWYHNYGGRGIRMCDEWIGEDGFMNFYNWAINNGYNDFLTIDRIDNNGNYSPENCRWVTVKQQSNNRRTNRIVEYKGESHTVSEWSEITGIKERTLLNRLDRWSVQEALEKEVDKRYSRKNRR